MLDIKSFTLPECSAFVADFNLPPFRAKQIYTWLAGGAASFDEMTNLPKDIRQLLSKHCFIANADVITRLDSGRTDLSKFLFRLHDGETVESVLMSYDYGYSLCLSTQVGCKMGCSFCATGKSGFVRNLLPSEMLSQLHAAQKNRGVKIGRLVLMGMGEPLDNMDNVLRFLHLVSDPVGMNLGMRKISLSTCGLVDQIDRLAEERLQLTLSVSLHAPTDELRSMLMPINRRFGLDALLTSCRNYTKKTGRRISFEYMVIDGVNDTDDCARLLAARLKGMNAHVNLIPVNQIDGADLTPGKFTAKFNARLNTLGQNATVRRTLGDDINAACGQLRSTTPSQGGAFH